VLFAGVETVRYGSFREMLGAGERRRLFLANVYRSPEWHTLDGNSAAMFESGELEGQKRAYIALERTFCSWTMVG
jgi:hypothetical protein